MSATQTAVEKNAALVKTKLSESRVFWDEVGDIAPSELPEDKKQFIDRLNHEIDELMVKVKEDKTYQEAAKANAELFEQLSKPVDRPNFGNGDTKEAREAKSLGERFAQSEEFKAWFKDVAPHGELPASGEVGKSPPFDFKALLTGLSTTSAGALVRRDYAGLVDFPFQPLTLRDVVTTGRTGSDLIEFPRVVSYTSAAAAVAESTTAPTSYGQVGNGLKPESSMVLEKVTESVKTVAHWIPVTRRAMSDAPQIETLINNFLDTGLELELERLMIQGDGTGEEFLGLDNTPNITVQPFDTDIITTARKARTKARVIGRAMSKAFVMHPYDWEEFDLTQNDTQGNFYFGGPRQMMSPQLWGLPVIESEAVLQGTFYTGDLKQAILWDRERATIRVSDAPNDFFLRNMLAILAELRAAFGVFRPPAIVRGDLHQGANS